MKRITAFVIITALILGAAACPVQAAASASDVPAGAVDYSTQLGDGRTIVIEPGEAYILGEDRVYTNLRIECKEGADLTIENLDINDSEYGRACPISFTGENNRLYYREWNSLTAGDYEAGIRVEGGTELTIQGDGYLRAEGGYGGAGVGGSANEYKTEKEALEYNVDCGRIVITGGDIAAYGGGDAAGIGGGLGGDGGVIEITGGGVYASANHTAAAIGCGGGFYRCSETEENQADEEASIYDGMNFIAKGGAGEISITGGCVTAAQDRESFFYPISIGCGVGGGSGGSVKIAGDADVLLEFGHISEGMDVTIDEDVIVYIRESGEGWSRKDEGYFKAAGENGFRKAIVRIDDPQKFFSTRNGFDELEPLCIIDRRWARRVIPYISENNVIEAYMPEGTYSIECPGYYDINEPIKCTREFEVKGDIDVTLQFYSVAVNVAFTCRYMDARGVYNMARSDSYDNADQRDFDLAIEEGNTAHLWATTPYSDVQFYINGEVCGDVTETAGGGLRLDTAVKVKPGYGIIEFKAVAGDGVTEEVYRIYTRCPMPVWYTGWFWAAAGAAAVLLAAAFAAKKLRKRKNTAGAGGIPGGLVEGGIR